MKTAFLAVAALFGAALPPEAGVSHFRYERPLLLPAGAAGQACAVLDSTIFAHARSQALDDLRVIRADKQPGEVPFRLSINDTQTTEDDFAPALNLHGDRGTMDFDLRMPSRPHSSVTLDLAAQNFLGTAVVSGTFTSGGPATALGTFAVFDLASQHLPRSTTLPLQETNFPLLHVQLRLHSSESGPLTGSIGLVRGAIVPPSRQAQRLYDVAASTTNMHREGADTVATLHLPEHVPAERVRFLLAPEYHSNFERNVDIDAVPDGASSGELAHGMISRVQLAPSMGEPIPIDSQSSAIDTAFAANFQAAATVRVVVHNEAQPPLPLQAVAVEMRQRQICFNAAPAAQYLILYGATDEASDETTSAALTSSEHPVIAQMGREIPNPQYRAPTTSPGMLAHQPDLLWVCSAGVLAILGSIALRRRRTRRA